MIKVLDGKNYDSAGAFVAELNTARLANKQKWIYYIGKVQGKDVEIKTFDAGYLQIMRVNGINHWAPMNMKISAWKKAIEIAITN